MHKITLFILAAVFAVALAEGQYYVPRAYYTIDAEGHESARVPLRRLRRSLQPYPYVPRRGSSATASAQAQSQDGGSAIAHADAQSGGWGGRDYDGNGGWGLPNGRYGDSNPALRAGMSRRQFGPVEGARSVSASTSVGVDDSGSGYYDQSAVVH